MATQPINCSYDVTEGLRFYKEDLVLDDGNSMNPIKYLSLSDLSIPVNTTSSRC